MRQDFGQPSYGVFEVFRGGDGRKDCICEGWKGMRGYREEVMEFWRGYKLKGKNEG